MPLGHKETDPRGKRTPKARYTGLRVDEISAAAEGRAPANEWSFIAIKAVEDLMPPTETQQPTTETPETPAMPVVASPPEENPLFKLLSQELKSGFEGLKVLLQPQTTAVAKDMPSRSITFKRGEAGAIDVAKMDGGPIKNEDLTELVALAGRVLKTADVVEIRYSPAAAAEVKGAATDAQKTVLERIEQKVDQALTTQTDLADRLGKVEAVKGAPAAMGANKTEPPPQGVGEAAPTKPSWSQILNLRGNR